MDVSVKTVNRVRGGLVLGAMLSAFMGVSACTFHHKIEVEKPITVNMNINHEIKLKIEEQNKDLLSIEQDALKQKKK